MALSKKYKNFITRLLIITAVWCGLALLTTASVLGGARGAASFTDFVWSFFQFGMRWFPWIVLTPIVLWLGDKYTFESHRWHKALIVHLPLSITFAYALATGSALFFPETTNLVFMDEQGARFVETNTADSMLQIIYGKFLINLPTALFNYWAILGVGHALNYHKKYRDKELASTRLTAQLNEQQLRESQLEKEVVTAKLQLLKGQLHPHFLFNTLHTIANLVRKDENDAAIDMIADLSDLLRVSLDKSQTQIVPLKEERKFTRLYTDIEKARFKNRLTIIEQFEEDTLDVNVPFLIFQPLIENSIRHGLAKDVGAGEIHLGAARNGKNLLLMVSDNGPGVPEEWTIDMSKGIGLKNIKERLDMLYKKNYIFEVKNRENSGLSVTIGLPLKGDDDA